MIQDLYIRNPSDPNYRIDVLSHSNPIESIKAKINMILGTRKGEVLGDLAFGMGIEDLIFETRVNAVKLQEDIYNQIALYVSEASDYDIQPKVSFGKADGYDYCVIDIHIDNSRAFGVIVK